MKDQKSWDEGRELSAKAMRLVMLEQGLTKHQRLDSHMET
jgi:hypothetical protein